MSLFKKSKSVSKMESVSNQIDVEDEMDMDVVQETIDKSNYPCPVQPPKKKQSRFRRGTMVLCLLVSPGSKHFQFINMRKEESILSNRQENQKFLIVEPPTLEILHKEKGYPVYVCDSEKGVTIKLNFDRDTNLASLFCDPKMVSNVFDESFVSKASNIKADWKQLVSIALFAFVFGGLFGLCF